MTLINNIALNMFVARVCVQGLRLGQIHLTSRAAGILSAKIGGGIINNGISVLSSRELRKMCDDNLSKVIAVDIDPVGTFKYILIRVYGKEKDCKEPSKLIVRGYKACPYHSDIYDKVNSDLENLQLEGECLGGGRIKHEPEEKRMCVYGYSQGYGKADHEVSVGILKKFYTDYEITWSDEGY